MNRQGGFSIVMAIFILVVLGLLGGYMVRLSGVQISTVSFAVQGARTYQAARAGIEWSIARIVNGGSCADIEAQTAMTFNGLDGISVKLSCSSQSYSEADTTATLYRITSLAEFARYSSGDYVARSIETTIIN